MNVKKFLGVATCSIFSLVVALGVSSIFQDSTFYDSASKKPAVTVLGSHSASDFTSSVSLTRDDFISNVKSVTTTSDVAKSANIEFESVRLTGYAGNKKYVYVVIDDSNFSGDPSDPSLDTTITKPTFGGYSIEVVDAKSSKDYSIVIPKNFTYGSWFTVNNTKIVADALSFSTAEGYTSKVTSIIIPSEIETIEAGAFVNVPDSVTMKCVASEKPVGWADGWCDAANITWGYELTTDEAKDLTQTIGATTKYYDENPTTYMLGYVYTTKESTWYCPSCEQTYTTEELKGSHVCPDDGGALIEIPDVRPAMDYPLVLNFKINTASGGTREVWEDLPITYADASNVNPYNSVTSSVYSRNYDMVLEEGETVDYTSFVFHNIYKSKQVKVNGKDEKGQDKEFSYLVPDTTTAYSSTAAKRFTNEIDIHSIIDYKFKEVTTFGDYTMISMTVDKILPSYYNEAMAATVLSNQDKINEGTYRIRYAFYDVSNSKYRVTYDNDKKVSTPNVEKLISVSTPLSVIVLEKDSGNQISFLIKNSDVGSDFSASKLRRFEFVSLTINMHLWDNKNSSIVSRTPYSVHFSEIDIMPLAEKSPSVFSIVAFIIIFNLMYVLVFAGASVGLFFWEKDKYKNDEFRRVKPKLFVKKAIISYVGSAVVLLTILSIIFRFSKFDNSVATSNPLDWFVVITGLVSVIIIGYFVKYIIGVVRTAKTRKLARKLKLNEDVADDGTK